MIVKTNEGLMISPSTEDYYFSKDEKKVQINFDFLPAMNDVYLMQFCKDLRELLELKQYIEEYVTIDQYYQHLFLACFYYNFDSQEVLGELHFNEMSEEFSGDDENPYLDIYRKFIDLFISRILWNLKTSRVIGESCVNISHLTKKEGKENYSLMVEAGSYYLLDNVMFDYNGPFLNCIATLIVRNKE